MLGVARFGCGHRVRWSRPSSSSSSPPTARVCMARPPTALVSWASARRGRRHCMQSMLMRRTTREGAVEVHLAHVERGSGLTFIASMRRSSLVGTHMRSQATSDHLHLGCTPPPTGYCARSRATDGSRGSSSARQCPRRPMRSRPRSMRCWAEQEGRARRNEQPDSGGSGWGPQQAQRQARWKAGSASGLGGQKIGWSGG